MINRNPRGAQVDEVEEYVADEGYDFERTERVETVDRAPVAAPIEARRDASYVSVHREVVGPNVAARKAQQTIWFFFGIIETLLALRFLLLALGANPASPFYAFVVGITNPLAAPFANLIATPRYCNAVLELGTAFGMVIYLLLAIALVKLVDLLLSRDAV